MPVLCSVPLMTTVKVSIYIIKETLQAFASGSAGILVQLETKYNNAFTEHLF